MHLCRTPLLNIWKIPSSFKEVTNSVGLSIRVYTLLLRNGS